MELSLVELDWAVGYFVIVNTNNFMMGTVVFSFAFL